MSQEEKTEGLERVASYIRNLRLRKAMVGGVDQEHVYKSMRELVSIFTQEYNAAVEQTQAAEERIRELEEQSGDSRSAEALADANAEVDRLSRANQAQSRELEELKQEVTELKATAQASASSGGEQVDSLRLENEELIRSADAVKQENQTLSQTVAALETDKQELEERVAALQEERERLLEKMSNPDAVALSEGDDVLQRTLSETLTERDGLLEELKKQNRNAEALRQDLSAEQDRVQMLQEELAAVRQSSNIKNTGLDELRQGYEARLQALMGELDTAKAESESIRREKDELQERLYSANSFEGRDELERETLEEIYLDATRRRRKIVAEASAKAEAIQRQAKEELEQARTQRERAHAEMEQQLSQLDERRQCMIRETEEQTQTMLEQANQDAEAVREEARAQAQSIVDEAKEDGERWRADADAEAETIIQQARAECERRVAEADEQVAAIGVAWRKERAKYDTMTLKLTEMRRELLWGLQEDIARLQKAAFDISNASIDRESKNVSEDEEDEETPVTPAEEPVEEPVQEPVEEPVEEPVQEQQ